MKSIRRVLFICTGNSCRSPMAEGILRHLWQQDERRPELVVESAGVSAFDGGRATTEAMDALRERGIDIKSHQSRTVRREMLLAADLIVTMTRSHKRPVLALAPEVAGRIFAMGELVEGGQDVADPFGGDLELYRQTAKSLEAACRQIIRRIEHGTIPNHDAAKDGGTHA